MWNVRSFLVGALSGFAVGLFVALAVCVWLALEWVGGVGDTLEEFRWFMEWFRFEAETGRF